MYQPEQYVKLTNPDGINMGFQYKIGLNEDRYELNRNQECAAGGLYFCQFKDANFWAYGYDGKVLIWKVDLPEGEEVIKLEKKLKAKRIILSDPKIMDKYGNISNINSLKYDGIVQYAKFQFKKWFGM